MNRGVYFDLPDNMTVNELTAIFDGIDIGAYTWENILSQYEIYRRDNDDKEIYDVYLGQEIRNLFQDGGYIIFLKLQAYKGGYTFSNCHTYEDFLVSDCELLMTICDVREIAIYAKDQEVIDRLYKNAMLNDYNDVRIVTDENDRRTGLDFFSDSDD